MWYNSVMHTKKHLSRIQSLIRFAVKSQTEKPINEEIENDIFDMSSQILIRMSNGEDVKMQIGNKSLTFKKFK